jgi:Flp pilus assembly pilin Flp
LKWVLDVKSKREAVKRGKELRTGEHRGFRYPWMSFFKVSSFQVFPFSRRGAVMMEYVIVAVLIAAACVLGVLVLSRAIARGWTVSGKGSTLEHGAAADLQQKAWQLGEQDKKAAEDYHDAMHQ